jgi:hypothetical protein
MKNGPTVDLNVDEDVAADRLACDGLQGEFRRIEVRSHLAGEEQLAVQVVGPLVVGADEPCRGAALGGADPAAAVAAGIVERPHLPLAVAHDHHRIIADLQRHVVAWLRDLAVMRREQPVAIPDEFKVDPVVIRVCVEGLFQAVAVAPVAQAAQHVVADVHVLSSLSKD